MNTTESNALIAEFMGWEKVEGFFMAFGREATSPGDLKFHSSWDWLMPVVEKIDQIGASVIIGRMFCEIKYIDPLNEEKHFDVRIASGVKMNAINGAIVDFITWYNLNK